MKPELKAKWVAALRSGRFNQSVGSLRNDQSDAYCCLGVLDLVGDLRSRSWATLDLQARRAAGITTRQADCLAKMNDLERRSFPEIADWIEANL